MYIFNNIRFKEIYDSIKAKDGNMVSYLMDFALRHHFTGNILKLYISYMLAYNENPFSISCENHGTILGNTKIILEDIKEFYNIYNDDYNDVLFYSEIENFTMIRDSEEHYDQEVSDLIYILNDKLLVCKNVSEFYDALISFYQNYGVGEMAFHKAFRISDSGDLIPVKNVLKVSFDDLIGYEWQKKRLIQNTLAFVNGKDANNALLYGDAGTGKSTSIKALLNMFYPKGLRMIEVYKHQMSDVANLIATFKKRHYSFIIYMDDLSFEENEIEYKHLKSIIEGGLEAKPKNVLVYATSNRRHLIKETFADNGGISDDIHRNETKAEKLSLASRFGLSIMFVSPNNIEFKNIVKALATKYKIEMPEEELLAKASTWELHYGDLSGRTAEQFIKYIALGGEEI